MSDHRPKYRPPVPFKRQGLLFLPAQESPPRSAASPLENHFGAVYVGLRDISRAGLEGSLRKVHQAAMEMNWRNAVFALSRIGLVLHNKGAHSDATQTHLLEGAFSPAMVNVIRAAAKRAKSRAFFFHKQQILFLMKEVLMRSLEVEKPDEGVEMDRLLNALLMTNDVLDHQFQSKLKPGARSADDGDILVWGLRNMSLNSSEALLLQFARHYHIYFSVSTSPEMKRSNDFVDLQTVFLEATGVPLMHFMAVGFSLLASFMRHEMGKNPSEEKNFLIRKAGYLAKGLVGNEAFNKALSQLALNPQAFRKILLEEDAAAPDDTYAFLKFRKYPVLELPEGYLMCIAPQFLEERICGGVYWDLFDHLRATDKPRSERLSRFFGQVFEKYVVDLIFRMIGTSTERVFGEIKYRDGKRELKSWDAVVVYPRTFVVVEVVNKKIKMMETILKGDAASYERDARQIVVEKAQQISRVIDDFKKGLFTIGGLTSADVDQYIPVVVTSQSFPQHFFAWGRFDEAMAQEGILCDKDTLPLCVMDAEELEMTEGFVQGGKEFSDLLRGRASNPHRTMPFKNYLVSLYGREVPRNKEMAKLFSTAADALTRTLFGDCAVAEAEEEERSSPSPTV